MCLYTEQQFDGDFFSSLIITWRSLQLHWLSALTFSYLTKPDEREREGELSLDFQSQLLLLIFRIFLLLLFFLFFTFAYGNYEFSLFSSLARSIILVERD